MHLDHIPGYDGGPYTHRPELLADPHFWLGHLYNCAQSDGAEELLLGADDEAGQALQQQLLQGDHWPVFTVPLRAGHRLHVVYRAFEDDEGIDYLLHHPDWDRAEQLATDDGHCMGPALSWPELTAAADNGLPGGSTADPHTRLLLLFPAFGDTAVPADAADRLAAALAARTRVKEPSELAAALLDNQGVAGRARWTTAEETGTIADGTYCLRDPANHFALPPARLARVSAALAP